MIKFHIKDGKVDVDYIGYKGKECDKVESQVIDALRGKLDIKQSSRMEKPEYYEEEREYELQD